MTCYECSTRVREDVVECPRCGTSLTFTLSSPRHTYGPYTIHMLRGFVRSGKVPSVALARRPDGEHSTISHLLLGEATAGPPRRSGSALGDAETILMLDEPLPLPPPLEELLDTGAPLAHPLTPQASRSRPSRAA